MSEYQINLENIFAGPLDLLLYLVRKDEVDIYDISIAKITEQYLEYIEIMKSLDLDVAGDFLVLAATLMEIKSAMLLPRSISEDEAKDENTDPRHELIKQLLEYKRFKDAATILDLKQQDQGLRFSRPDSLVKSIKPEKEPELDMEQVSIWHLLETFDNLMRQTGKYQDYSKIQDDTPIDVYQVQILERLQFEGPMTFEHIFQDSSSRLIMIGLFLGLLELVRNKLVWVEQADTGTIYLKALTDDPAEEAVQTAILATEEERLAAVAARMESMEKSDAQTTSTDSAEPLAPTETSGPADLIDTDEPTAQPETTDFEEIDNIDEQEISSELNDQICSNSETNSESELN